MKHILFSISVLLCCFSWMTPYCYAQKGKIVKRILSAASEKQIPAAAASLSGKLPASAASVAAAHAVKPLPKTSFSSEDKRYLQDVGTMMTLSLNKKILNYSFALEQERTNARRLVATLQNYQTLNLNDLQENALLEKMSGFLVNNSLQNYLLDSMVNKNYMQFMRDLANYYSLSVKFMTSYELRFIAAQDTREIFAQTALDYMKTHPHKMNLKLREIMKSPFVSGEIKSSLRSFIALNQILPQHESSFLTVLREAHKQHSNGLSYARAQEDVTATVEIYRSSAKELESFVKRYNRSPRWNAPLSERRLYNKLLLLLTHNQANQFKQVTPYITQIKQILEQFPHVRFSASKTLQQLQKFIKKNNRLPRAITEVPATVKISDQELELYENIFYWESQDKAFAKQLLAIKKELAAH